MSIHNAASDLSQSPVATSTTNGILFTFGDGAPPASASGYAKGCLYVRTDASSTTTRLYINSGTNTSATWSTFTASA
jgi:hypothetical protein